MNQTEVIAIADRVEALQQLTATTGTITKRTVSSILRNLPDETLLAVAVELRRRKLTTPTTLSEVLGGRR